MLLSKRINSPSISTARAQPCITRFSVVSQRNTSVGVAVQQQQPRVAPCTVVYAQQGSTIAEANQVPQPNGERVLGWQRTLTKVVLGALFCGVMAGIALLWGQPPSALLSPGSGLSYTMDAVGLTSMASYLTKQQAIALVWGVFMFLSTAAGPMLTLGDRNVAPILSTHVASSHPEQAVESSYQTMPSALSYA